MTTSEPDSAAESTTTPQGRDTLDDGSGIPQRQSRWSRLDRYNKVAALVLTGVTSLFVAVLIFGAGVLVGAEFGNAQGHDRESETSDRGAGDHGGSDDFQGRGSGDLGDRGAGNGSEDVREQPNERESQGDPDEGESGPTSQAPTSSIPPTPRP